jgi:hypothetical protein
VRQEQPPVSPVSDEGIDLAPVMEEELILDARARLRPAARVEQRLIALLRGSSVPVSHTVAASHGRHRRLSRRFPRGRSPLAA